MRITAILFLVAVVSTTACADQAPHELAVTLVGTAGFVLAYGEMKTGIDALFTYQIPADIQSRMEEALPPFDLDLILVTHRHSDHVHPLTVGRNMLANPSSRLVAPSDVISAVLSAMPDLDPARCIGLDLDTQDRFSLTVAGIEIEAFSFPHPPSGQPNNAGFRLRIAEFTIYHAGDLNVETALADFAGYGFPEVPLDLAFVPYFQLSPPYATTLDHLPAHLYVPMHLRAGDWASKGAELAEDRSDLLVFGAPMETHVIGAP